MGREANSRGSTQIGALWRHLGADNGAEPFPILSVAVAPPFRFTPSGGFRRLAVHGAPTLFPRSLRRPDLLLVLTLALWVVQWAV